MNKLTIKYKPSNIKKWFGLAAAIYLLGVSASNVIADFMNDLIGIRLYFYAAGVLFSLVLILMYTVFEAETDIVLDDDRIMVKMPKQKTLETEWVRVSRVEVTAGYIRFHLNGGIQVYSMQLDTLEYKDVSPLINYVVHQCETKNIVCDK